MIIKSISLENFQCYAGSYHQNNIHFKEGINIVIGDNGSGKSKLFDAFYWVLYDRVFDSATRQFRDSKIVADALVSDKAKHDCAIGEKISAKVQLELVETSEYLGQNTFVIERTYTISKSKDSNDKEEWILPGGSKLEVFKKTLNEHRPVTDREQIENIIKRFLPDDIKPYLWFQGEQVDSLIDFQDKNTLTKAINALSDISTFDKYVTVAEKAHSQAKRLFEKEQKNHINDKTKFEKLITDKNHYERILSRSEKELLQIKQNIALAEEDENNLIGKIEDAENVSKLRRKKDQQEKQLETTTTTLTDAQKGFTKNLFTRSWILKNSAGLFKIFEDKQRAYELERERILTDRKAEQKLSKMITHRLPVNMPSRKILEEMLQENKCFVCNSDISEDHIAQEHIKSLVDRAKETTNEKPVIPNNFSNSFRLLYNVGFEKEKIIANVDSDIRNEMSRIQNLVLQKKDVENEIAELDQKLSITLGSSSFSINDSDNIVNKFRSLRRHRETQKDEERKILARIQEAHNRIASIETELASLVTGGIDEKVERKKDAFTDFFNVAVSTRDRVYQEQLDKIEEEANKHFQSMTEDNQSVRGRIKIKSTGGTYMPKIVDDQGNELTSINDSNIILVKLSVIMAIVSGKGRSSEFYPLISDAPTSKFSDNYTIGFCNAVSKVFKQSIIMSYDFYHNQALRDRLFCDVENRGSVYIIEPNISEQNRLSRRDLHTLIKEVI